MKNKDVMMKIMALERMDISSLNEEFVREFGFRNRSHRTETIRRRLQYRLQEKAFGGLTEREQELLDVIAGEEMKSRRESKRRSLRLTLPGTRISRFYRGKEYEVTVGQGNTFVYLGRTYRSLSAVAREITGVNWNGRRFFGVK